MRASPRVLFRLAARRHPEDCAADQAAAAAARLAVVRSAPRPGWHRAAILRFQSREAGRRYGATAPDCKPAGGRCAASPAGPAGWRAARRDFAPADIAAADTIAADRTAADRTAARCRAPRSTLVRRPARAAARIAAARTAAVAVRTAAAAARSASAAAARDRSRQRSIPAAAPVR